MGTDFVDFVPAVACNRRWIVVAPQRMSLLYVYKVTDKSVVIGTDSDYSGASVDSSSSADSAYSSDTDDSDTVFKVHPLVLKTGSFTNLIRFLGPSEYDADSDILEVISIMKGGCPRIRINNIDLNTIWDSKQPEIPDTVVGTCSLVDFQQRAPLGSAILLTR